MMATFRRALSSRSTSPLLPPNSPDRRTYRPVTGADDENEAVEGYAVSRDAGGGDGAGGGGDKRVTWAFWVLGAGVLLSWNGES